MNSSDSEPVESSSEDEQEEQQGDDRQLTGANADPRVLQFFWDLASLEHGDRQAAASSLVQALVDSQKQLEGTHRPADAQPGGSLDAQQEGGNRQQRMEQCLNCCSPLMAYGLKRLARGLASSRQGARQGFAAALAATLAHSAAAAAACHKGSKKGGCAASHGTPLQLPFVSAAGALALLEACLEVTGSMKGSDQRDALLGRVFGLAALARSGLAAALPAAPAGSVAVPRSIAVVAEQLVGLLQRKAFLRESAAAALVELLGHLKAAEMQQVLGQAPKLTALLQAPPAAASPESLFIALRLWHNLPVQQLQGCQLLPALPAGAAPPPELFWQQPGAVQRSSVAAAAAALFAAGQVRALCPALLATTASHPRLHPVWGCVLALLVPGFVPVKVLQQQPEDEQKQQQQGRAAPDQQQLSNLWQHFVEASCLNSSHERKALALQLLQLLLPVLTPEAVPVLLGRQLLGCISTALRNKDSYLHASARKCMDRISSCVEHSLVARSDPALAAKLRLALAAQLQSANLQHAAAAAADGKAKGQQGILQGLDTAGVAAYVDQLLHELVAAVGQQQGAANGAAAAAGESSEDADMVDADAELNDTKSRQLLDQMTAALRLPAADSTTLRKGLTFLAAAAFLQLPRSLDASALAVAGSAAAPAAAAAAATPAGKQSKKKHKAGKGSSAAAGESGASGDPLLLEKDVLQLAARMQPQPQQQVRQYCAARLIMLLHSLHHRAGQQTKQQQQQDGKGQQGPSGETKKQRKARLQSEHEQAAAAARQAAWQLQEALTTQLLQLVTAAQQLDGVQPTADEDIFEQVQQLQGLEASVLQHVQQQKQQQQAATATRSRVVLQLLHQLQLQLLSGGLSAEAAGSVVDDLELAVVRGLGLPSAGLGIDKAAAAALHSSGSGSEEEAEAGEGSEDSSEGGEGDPAWQDVLLDLLLALLSNGSSGDAVKGGGVLVPSAPLRESCEAVFRAFAEEMTAEGLSDMLRVLGQRASEAIKREDEEGEGEEVEMEEGEASEEKGGEEEGVDDDEDGASGSDDAEQQQQQAFGSEEEQREGSDEEGEDDAAGARQKLQQQPAAAAAGRGSKAGQRGSEQEGSGSAAESDDEDDNLDDAAMMRLDAQLGAAVRSMLAGRGGSTKERAASLLGLQLRVAALLEEWLKKCSKSPLVLQVVLPLLRALVSASGAGGNPTLADRLGSIASKQLSRCRPVLLLEAPGQQQPTGQQQPVELAAYQADLRKVLYYASRERDPRVAAAAGQALLVLVGAGSEAGGSAAAAAAQAAAADAMQDFFGKKKSRLQKGWCEQLLARCPEAVLGGEAAGLAAILTACSKGRNESVRCKAVALLPVLLRGVPQGAAAAPSPDAPLLAALQRHQAVLAGALSAAVAGPYRGKEQHAAAVKAVVGLLAGVGRLAPGRRLAELVGSEAVRELGRAVVVVKAAGVAPRVESQLDRLVEVAGLQQLVSAGKPDPARLALLRKQRAAMGAKAGGAAAAAGSKRPQQPGDEAAAGEVGDAEGGEQEAGEVQHNNKKKRQHMEEQQVPGKGSRQQQQQQQQVDGSKGKKEKKDKQATAAGQPAAAGKRSKENEEQGKGKKKHKKQQ